MDTDTKKSVLQSQRTIPRFLYRGWCNSASRASGGHPELNTIDAIVPYAFFVGEQSQGKTLYDMSRDQFHHLTRKHLQTQNCYSQFSPWASSLQIAIHFASRRSSEVCKNCHISVVDTKMLRSRNVFVYVPALAWLGPGYNYKHEYLAHGVKSDTAHKAVPLLALNSIGIPIGNNYAIDLGIRPATHRLSEYETPITLPELQRAISVARLYDGDFVVPVMIAILALTKRDSCLWRCEDIKGLEMIAHELGNHHIPEDWCEDADILTDIVDSGGYGEVEQTIRLMRALLNYQYGRGARGRVRTLHGESA